MANILITGGSGMIGRKLTSALQEKNHSVAWFSTSLKSGDIENVDVYSWDLPTKTVSDEAKEKKWDYVFHLAGAGVADKRWTAERKKEILQSRVQSTNVLHEFLAGSDQKPKAVISASAIGYYGFKTSNEVIDETGTPGDDFLAKVTQEWENHTESFTDLNIRNVRLRIGIVLAKEGGALAEMNKPPVITPLASGKQWMPWIHVDDLVSMFIFAMENDSASGIYNAAGNNQVTNEKLSKALAKACKKPFVGIGAPGFVLKLVLGEMHEMVTQGTRVSNNKIKDAGFKFTYDTVEEALKEIYG